MTDIKLYILDIFHANSEKFIISIIFFLVFIASTYSIYSFVESFGKRNKILEKRIRYVIKLIHIISILCFIIFLSVIWGLNYKGLLIFASSIFTVLGIALFATWSILSNIVSSIIIFFSCPYKIGDWIKIVDGENTLEGKISDINFYNLILEDENHNLITYPNNVIIQKAVIKRAE